MKCKNVECNNDVKKGRVYCSLTCRNVYVNTHLRDYSKVSKTLIHRGCEIRAEYNLNPNLCIQCNSVLPYNIRKNKFCNNSCSATYTNKKRVCSYMFSDKGLSNIVESNKKLYKLRVKTYLTNPNKCTKCNTILMYDRRYSKRCSECIVSSFRTDEYYIYRRACNFKFNLANYPNEFKFELIEEHGWYKAKNKGDNLYGVSRDHIYSVKDGFLNKINPNIISHPANCRLVLHSDNASKGDRSDITIEELLGRIKCWDEKYIQS